MNTSEPQSETRKHMPDKMPDLFLMSLPNPASINRIDTSRSASLPPMSVPKVSQSRCRAPRSTRTRSDCSRWASSKPQNRHREERPAWQGGGRPVHRLRSLSYAWLLEGVCIGIASVHRDHANMPRPTLPSGATFKCGHSKSRETSEQHTGAQPKQRDEPKLRLCRLNQPNR